MSQSSTAISFDGTPSTRWLFSRSIDLFAFAGSAALAAVALVIGAPMGWLNADAPDAVWVPAVLLVDVAHVYATGFRVYFDPVERRRRPALYYLTPIVGYVLGVALYSEGALVFWRCLAYVAIFHFVRQQYGWVALYRGKAGETDRVGHWIDASAIYLATIYPLVFWHAHLPRKFHWFLTGDFASAPIELERALRPIYWLSLGLYALHSLYLGLYRRRCNPGKDIVVLTTAWCWHIGIITYNSDFAFTVTNVLIHGIPYIVLVWWNDGRTRRPDAHPSWPGLVRIVGAIWILAYMEELFWDRGVWHERDWLFGPAWNWGDWSVLIVPLLAVPQWTHYILDGFIWRRRWNPDFRLVPAKSAT